jgi:4-hydroxy-tetrahydrodipicolinate synthase
LTTSRFGLSCAIATPFDAKGDVDAARLAVHAMSCLERGCDSVTLFGTTGEGASIGLSARGRIFDAMIGVGIEPRRQLLSTVVASSIEEAAEQARMALDANVRGLLLTPPFYFRGVSDDALFAWFGQLFDRLGAEARDMFAYHLPSVTGMPLSVDLIGRLKTAFPGIVVGVKDSSATWSTTEALLAAHDDLMILVGDERDLAEAVRRGGSGTICGVANVAPEILASAARYGRDDPRIRQVVEAIVAQPVLPAIKALIAHQKKDPGWRRMRPPLVDLEPAAAKELVAAFEAAMAMLAGREA